jgi:iron-sulfur cluster repair protein YtfE (RIC family)
MDTKKPLKRHIALQPLSREHHQGLLLSWKVRKGLSKGVELKRISKYVHWFYTEHLQKHFSDEEEFVFPVLGNDHELVKRALAEHRRLIRLMENEEELERSLHAFEEELEKHIRFEERTLFNEIQTIATSEQLKKIEEVLNEDTFCDSWDDQFWK